VKLDASPGVEGKNLRSAGYALGLEAHLSGTVAQHGVEA
jgi:hypothetical protein